MIMENGHKLLISGELAMLTNVMDMVSSYVYAKDRSGVYLMVNEAMATAYDTTANDMVGKTDADFGFCQDLIRQNMKDDLEVMDSLKEKTLPEEAVKSHEGEIIWLQTTKRPILNQAGDCNIVLCIAEVVTERKAAAKREKALVDKLGKSEKMESVGVLASGIAHDLNNMLSPLLGYPELIHEMIPPENPSHELLEEIEKAAKQASGLIQGLLTMARRNTKKTEVIDMNNMLEEFLGSGFVKDLVKTKPRVSFEKDINADLPMVNIAPSNLHQIVMNFTKNAFEAMDEKGSVTVRTFSTRRRSDPDDPASPEITYAALSVVDTGSGIKKVDLDKIFEPFFSTKKMGSSGTGLGLAIVFGLIEDAGGMVEVTSKAGEGSSFTALFPGTANELESKGEPKVLPNVKARVLVVDDLPSQRRLASRFLEKVGCEVITAESGMVGVDLIRRNQIDVVVIDMIMEGGMDGLDTFRAIQHHRPGTPCIIASGYARTARIQKAIELGASAYISKPYTILNLAHEVDVAFASKSVG